MENSAGPGLAADEAIVAMGANLPLDGESPQETLARAVSEIEKEWRLTASSGLWRTPAWPDPADPPFVNACVRLTAVRQSPDDVLAWLHDLERRLGRERRRENAPRTLDLDLIDLAGRREPGPGARLPHPRAVERAFVLLPLRDVAPLWRDPVSGRSVGDLLESLPNAAFSGVERMVSLHCEKDR